jgi:hypothetical protein
VLFLRTLAAFTGDAKCPSQSVKSRHISPAIRARDKTHCTNIDSELVRVVGSVIPNIAGRNSLLPVDKL